MELSIVEAADGWRVLAPKDRFDGISFDRFRRISVDNPDDPYGPPIYEGPAWQVSQYLRPGTYTYEFGEDDFYD